MGLFDIFKSKQKSETTNKNNSVQEIVLSDLEIEEILKEIKDKTNKASYKITTMEDVDLSIFESKFGGLPYWDLKIEYPKDEHGNNMIMLAQINFEKEKLEDELLPKKGILQFFVSSEDGYGLLEKNGYKVYYHNEINSEVSKNDILELGIKTSNELNDFPIKKELALKFEKNIEALAPTAEDKFENLFKEIAKEKFDKNITAPIYNVLDEDNYNKLCDAITGCKILGYPYFTQQEPAFVQDNILLLQIDSGNGIMWGDFGVANFFINEQDLKNKDFSKVLYTWDCG